MAKIMDYAELFIKYAVKSTALHGRAYKPGDKPQRGLCPEYELFTNFVEERDNVAIEIQMDRTKWRTPWAKQHLQINIIRWLQAAADLHGFSNNFKIQASLKTNGQVLRFRFSIPTTEDYNTAVDVLRKAFQLCHEELCLDASKRSANFKEYRNELFDRLTHGATVFDPEALSFIYRMSSTQSGREISEEDEKLMREWDKIGRFLSPLTDNSIMPFL